MKRILAHVPAFIPEAEDYKLMFPVMEELIKKDNRLTFKERMDNVRVDISFSVEELNTLIRILNEIGFDYVVYDGDECINDPYKED